MSDRFSSLPAARVLVAGATGLVGGHALRLLLNDARVTRVRALLRRPVSPDVLMSPLEPASLPAGKLVLDVAAFDCLGEHPSWFEVDWVFCALGTTIAKAGSQQAFREVDFEHPLRIARLAKAAGARHFLLVSALGADASSRVFYNRVKGELEDAVKALGFESTTFARPSLLTGDRADFRLGEAVGQRLGWLVPAPFKPVRASQVALGLVNAAIEGRPGLHILANADMRRLPVSTPHNTTSVATAT